MAATLKGLYLLLENITVLGIVNNLHLVLGLQEILFQNLENFIPGLQGFIYCIKFRNTGAI